ncbi:HAD family hydrolase [Arcobacter roscoffensis]|uniref:phosphoglycolate phosphatase n=1 Tax=Arcobacter roscoffensis TaxID=2961520 RepID=A0ABY5E6Z0_9BACT|nr:HAD family hydrolase [Arcobacter roscoffensis]UTJ06473.1 HAD family hydrolase [Arcobacter roscoffensis]
MKNKAIIFDLDGTLIDSLEDIAICMNQVLIELNLPHHELNDYKNFVGGGIDFLVNNALADDTNEKVKEEVTNRFKVVYDQKLHAKTKPYDGIYELLEELEKRDYKIGILSNKPHEFTIAYANSLFSQFNIEEIHGQKAHIEKKPNPSAAIQIANSFETPCEEVYFVGDTQVDMQTAKNAKMKGIGVLWGFRTKEELLESGADFLVKKPLDILDIIE